MKRVLICLLFLAAGFAVQAQESEKIHEVGLYFQNVDQFGLRYKVGHDDIRYRFTTTALSFNKSDYPDSQEQNSNSHWGVQLGAGLEKHKPLADNFGFYYGPEINLLYTRDKNKTEVPANETIQNQHGIGLGAIIGFRYQLAETLSLSAEFVPNIYYQKTTGSSESDYWNFYLNTNQVGLTLAYQF
ncbi:hypothetical protein [Mangrovibacterium diazotrophicum]|uniref:Outer membrane protein with beta-barrel domain n=1 Tax=Mangrovibacterium diazotrophicum TaxID=1261403 RepID=A0A419VWJ0_9BACT|nr:hypothetical protein [Mangrovibacterium diazotrophicum]RKD86478.1 hypothetical protein BC643_4171 [Mangrovibacterium diazotrophicum]